MRFDSIWLAILIAANSFVTVGCHAQNAQRTDNPKSGSAVSLELEEARGFVRVALGDSHFADYIYKGLPSPAIYPIVGPGGQTMTRHYPFIKNVPGEASDHPHHRSLWYAHGQVNGVDFWHGNASIVTQGEPTLAGDKIETVNQWIDGDGKIICTDQRRIRFGMDHGARVIDFAITFHADHGDVTFGDTKEGTMAIRTHPNLRITNAPDRGVTTANGQAINNVGNKGRELWGKRAAWVDYWGDIDGQTIGVAIFDHPDNPRYPTWWHARDYGLVAANPFGVHDFEKKPAGTGDFTIKAGQSATFRYRFIFHEGDATQARIPEHYGAWADDHQAR